MIKNGVFLRLTTLLCLNGADYIGATHALGSTAELTGGGIE
jgi:hypothetical protein